MVEKGRPGENAARSINDELLDIKIEQEMEKKAKSEALSRKWKAELDEKKQGLRKLDEENEELKKKKDCLNEQLKALESLLRACQTGLY